jgi:Domain of unknown function (DUF4062)
MGWSTTLLRRAPYAGTSRFRFESECYIVLHCAANKLEAHPRPEMSVPTVRLQVFLSSTSQDLESEREILLSRIARHGYFVAGMEQWPASGIPTLEFIQDQIRESDFVIVVTADAME